MLMEKIFIYSISKYSQRALLFNMQPYINNKEWDLLTKNRKTSIMLGALLESDKVLQKSKNSSNQKPKTSKKISISTKISPNFHE